MHMNSATGKRIYPIRSTSNSPFIYTESNATQTLNRQNLHTSRRKYTCASRDFALVVQTKQASTLTSSTTSSYIPQY